MEKQPLLNTFINNVPMSEVVNEIDQLIKNKQKAYIVPINIDVVVKINQDTYLKKIVDNADMVLVDGKPLVWIARLLKVSVKEKVSGADLVPAVCRISAQKGYRLFIIGGKKGVAEAARKKLEQQMPDIRIVGTYAPPFGFEKDEAEILKINRAISTTAPDIVIACFGCPKQEKWIYENYKKYDSIVSICAGATVDFLAGNVKRAPKWMSNCGLEWFYRFLQEPKRMFRRYFVDDLKIIKLIWRYRKKGYEQDF